MLDINHLYAGIQLEALIKFVQPSQRFNLIFNRLVNLASKYRHKSGV